MFQSEFGSLQPPKAGASTREQSPFPDMKTALRRRRREIKSMRDQRPCSEFRSWREIVSDPLTRALMAADHLTPKRVAAVWIAASRPRLGTAAKRPTPEPSRQALTKATPRTSEAPSLILH